MDNITLNKVNLKLYELSKKYQEILPKFYQAQVKYTQTRARIMRQQYGNFGSQPAREAAVEELMEKEEVAKEYNELLPEKLLLDTEIRIFTQISKNLVTQSWEVGGGV